MSEGKNEAERRASAGRRETQTLGRLGKARDPSSSSSEGKRGREHLQKRKKDPHSGSVWSASFRAGTGGRAGSEGASRGPKPGSQGPCSNASPVQRRSRLSRVIRSASPKGSSSEMSERRSISGTGNRFGERDEAQRMSGEGGHKETGCSPKQTHG